MMMYNPDERADSEKLTWRVRLRSTPDEINDQSSRDKGSTSNQDDDKTNGKRSNDGRPTVDTTWIGDDERH